MHKLFVTSNYCLFLFVFVCYNVLQIMIKILFITVLYWLLQWIIFYYSLLLFIAKLLYK